MPLTTGGIYYAKNDTPMSLADITAAMATSVSNSLNILQIVTSAQLQNVTTSDSTNYIQTTLSANITPSSVSSKIIVLVNSKLYAYTSALADLGGNFRLNRNSKLINSSNVSFKDLQKRSFFLEFNDVMTMNFIDSPNSVESIKYTVTCKSPDPNVSLTVSNSTITLLEIG